MKRLAVLIGLVPALVLAQDATDAPKKLDAGKLAVITTDAEQLEIEQAIVSHMSVQQDRWFHDGDYPAIIHFLQYQFAAYPFSEDVNTSLGWMYGNIDQRDKEVATYAAFNSLNPGTVDGPYPLAQFY
ncbi:hypothetical protein ABTL90_19075, partial [Acinetobacter baumannii]